jgi:transketolase
MDFLRAKAAEIRRMTMRMITRAGGGHVGASLSEADILTVLYFHTMKLDPREPDRADRDRFVLSKGHASEGLYCTLAAAGFIDPALLDAYLEEGCPLTIHPTNRIPGVEATTGALGHGFSVAVGMALGARRAAVPGGGTAWRVFVLTGDGELQEGSNWEAAMAASQFGLGNLTVLVDNNGLQLAGTVADTMNIEPLGEKFGAFGFDVHRVDGHSTGDLAAVLESLDYSGGRPHAVIAKTVKGKGVSFMEQVPEWHHRIPTEEECRAALKELGA